MTNDPILDAFLNRQADDGMALARASGILDVFPSDDTPPSRFIARYRARTLVVEADSVGEGLLDIVVGIHFDRNYLRRVDPFRVLTFVSPPRVFHPNIRPPFICLGPITPGTGLADLLYRVYDVVTFHKMTPLEDDALNARACAWTRRHRHRFPVDPRPLKRTRS